MAQTVPNSGHPLLELGAPCLTHSIDAPTQTTLTLASPICICRTVEVTRTATGVYQTLCSRPILVLNHPYGCVFFTPTLCGALTRCRYVFQATECSVADVLSRYIHVVSQQECGSLSDQLAHQRVRGTAHPHCVSASSLNALNAHMSPRSDLVRWMEIRKFDACVSSQSAGQLAAPCFPLRHETPARVPTLDACSSSFPDAGQAQPRITPASSAAAGTRRPWTPGCPASGPPGMPSSTPGSSPPAPPHTPPSR